ncbi:cbb3-type cytochrome c oxidase subunit I [Haloferula sp. A504]|uniref:cbb3-type cytochrome c oxidase subunit I n=1 Tax=Haloferula sp. A504 TaxID=3373601 RepID=UPI0031C72882|nr:cbb3-type cytochrome c oxidase subunit I [Verrucomicrobiaceae bacterium E54]
MSAPSDSPDDIRLRSEIDRSLRHPVMFFFTSGAAWLAVAILLGIISSAKVHSPGFWDSCPWMTYGRVQPAHETALVYGWGCQAAFGMIIWLMSRLSRQPCRNAGTILMAGHVWNLALSLGVIGILAGGGTGMPWMEMPSFAWIPMLLSYIAITIWSMVQFKVRPQGHTYISQWYLMAALIWFPWFFGSAHFLVHGFSGSPLGAAGVNAWFHSAMLLLFFAPVAIGMAYYLVPKVTGRPVYNYALSLIGFWSLAIIAPWAGLQKLTGAPIPNFLPYLGAFAAILFAVPAAVAGINLLKTAAADGETVNVSPTLRFTVWGLVFLLALGAASLLLNSPGIATVTQFTIANYGFDVLGVYGFFSFVAFGAIYFIVPRITRREWLSRRLIKWHFFVSIYGVISIVVVTLFGALMQGVAQETTYDSLWYNASSTVYPYAVLNTVAWCFLLISNFFFFIHLTLMWLRLGRRSSHPTLLVHRHSGSPHGPEGDIDNTGTASAH